MNPRTLDGPTLGLSHAVRYVLDPQRLYAECFARYGDPFEARTPLGALVVTGDPAAVRAMYTADPDTFGVWLPEMLTPTLGERSLLVTDGATHRAHRKLLAPAFHGAHVRSFGALFAAAAEREAAGWRPGGALDARDAARRISLDVILSAVFGVRDAARGAQVRDALVELVDVAPLAVTTRQLAARGLAHAPRVADHVARALGAVGPWARFERARARVDARLYEEIGARRAGGALGQDVLGMMLAARYDDGAAMSDREVRDELLTLLVAGHETTTIALSWALYEVLRSERVGARLRAELDACGPDAPPHALGALPYLNAVCDETLRTASVVPDIIRTVRRPFELAGHVLAPGTALVLAVAQVHHREEVYPDAHAFRPERFLERRFTPFEFLPFGGGGRRCLGAAFASFELTVVLATLLRERELRLASPALVRPIRRSLTVGPRRPIELVCGAPRHAPARPRPQPAAPA